jgi:predicted nucleic acid-binding protein
MLHDLQQDVNAGVLRWNPVDWPAVHQQAEVLSRDDSVGSVVLARSASAITSLPTESLRLSSLHTPAAEHRLVDILHVATALPLGVGRFLTFDAQQRALAKAAGLDVPV